MAKTRIAILGLGTVGYGVYKIINERLSDKIEVKKVFGRDYSKKELVGDIITTNLDEILKDDEISIVVETLGGIDFAYQLDKKVLESKKNLVTANKEIVARYLSELTEIKERNNVSFSFEASVGGGVPIIKNLIDISNTNDITNICGIINGTTNFILTRLNQGYSFDDAMKEAIEKGFAEADSSYDLDGLDMASKITILTMLATKKQVSLNDVYKYSMKNASLEDFNFVRNAGFTIKYLASYENNYLSVEPRLVKGMFALVNDEYNLISVDASNYTNLKFYGKGAGRFPTANAVVNDIVDIINGNKNYTFIPSGKLEIKEDNNEYIFYLRVKDINKVDKDIIFLSDKKERIITKNIKKSMIDFDNVLFYAKAK